MTTYHFSDTDTGWISNSHRKVSPFFNQRPSGKEISLLVIHNISLPAGDFGTGYIQDLFMGCLDCQAHESFSDLIGLEVSAHFLIDRQGDLIQFVSTEDRAWHAGVSSFQGEENCNDFSIGIELEGVDHLAYTDGQYQTLVALTKTLREKYDIPDEGIVGHSDIAPGRKTDPGPSFNWERFITALGD